MKGGCRKGGAARGGETGFMVQRRRSMRQAVGNEWTMDSPTGWVVGEGEDERKVEVHSTSTDSRPVPSHASAQRPQASPGGGGSKAVLLSLGCQEVSLVGGRPSSLGGFIGREPWNRTAPRSASALLQGPAVSATPCFEITRKRKGSRSQRTNVPKASASGIAISEGSSLSVIPSCQPRRDGHPTPSMQASSAPSVDVQLPADNQQACLQVQPCPSTSDAQISSKVNCNCRCL